MNKPINLEGIRIITISGRIAAGSTTLAKKLSETLGWRHVEGGEIIWKTSEIEKIGAGAKDTDKRPDNKDCKFDAYIKKLLKNDQHLVIETKLAGFNAQGIDGVFKILVISSDEHGKDQAGVRIDRLVNREHMSINEAKEEVLVREKNDIGKWRRLYAKDDPEWVYWKEECYDLVVNTFAHDSEESLKIALKAINFNQ